MHSIERYGIVALLFLVVTVVAVLMWDGGKAKNPKEVVGVAPTPAGTARAHDQQRGQQLDQQLDQQDEAARRLSLLAESQPGPLQRKRARAKGAAEAQPDRNEGAALSQEYAEPSEDWAPETDAGDAPEVVPQAGQSPREQPAPEQVVGALPAGATYAYKVRAGDTLSEIAQRELGSSRRWKEIAAANPGLDPAKLWRDATIRIPGRGPADASATLRAEATPGAGAAKTAASKTTPSKTIEAVSGQGAKTWKVGPGESLWKIATQTLGDGKRWREIAALNPSVNPDRLTAGQVLKLPAGTAPARTKPSAQLASAPTSGASSKTGSRTPAKTAPKPSAKPKADSTRVASNASAERTSRRGGKVK